MKPKITLTKVGISDVPMRKWMESSYRINRIHVPIKGRALYRGHNETVQLNEGYLYLLVNGFSQNFSTIGDDPYYHLYFDFQSVPSLLTAKTLRISLASDPYLQALLQAATLLLHPHIGEANMDMVYDKDWAQFPQAEQLLDLILSRLFEKGEVEMIRNPKIEDAIAYIEAHYQEPMQNADIAKSLSVDKRYLIRLFSRYLSISPYQYLTQYRVERAQELLQSGISVGKTAEQCGFQSESAFRIAFKRITGLAPTALRKAEKNKKGNSTIEST